jgi:hypothetical protein
VFLREIIYVEVFQFKHVIVEKNTRPLGERVGGECSVELNKSFCRVLAVEATGDVFYVFLPLGDAFK